MSDAHTGHFLPGHQRFPDTEDTVHDVVAETVIFTGVDPDHKAWLIGCDPDDLPDDRLHVPDIIDLLSDDVAPCHIGVRAHRLKGP